MDSLLTVLGAGGTALAALGILLRRVHRPGLVIDRDASYVLAMAVQNAARRGHRPTTVGHLAPALLFDASLARALEERGVSLKGLYDDLERLLPPPVAPPGEVVGPDYEPGIVALLRASGRHIIVVPGPHHILRALLRSEHHAICAVFGKHGLSAERWPAVLRKAVVELPAMGAHETGPYRGVPTTRANTSVIFWNDKKTTMEFVIELLRITFDVVEPHATRLMLTTDREGSAVVGTYEPDVAEQLAEAAMQLARERGFPLVVTTEKAGRASSRSRIARLLRFRKGAWVALPLAAPAERPASSEAWTALPAALACPSCGNASTRYRVLVDALSCTACGRSFEHAR